MGSTTSIRKIYPDLDDSQKRTLQGLRIFGGRLLQENPLLKRLQTERSSKEQVLQSGLR